MIMYVYTVSIAKIISAKNPRAMGIGFNGFISRKINENENIKEKKIMGAV